MLDVLNLPGNVEAQPTGSKAATNDGGEAPQVSESAVKAATNAVENARASGAAPLLEEAEAAAKA